MLLVICNIFHWQPRMWLLHYNKNAENVKMHFSLCDFTNPHFVLLIRGRRFVLFSLRHASVFVINHQHLHYAYVIRRSGFCLWQLAELRIMCLYCFKYGYLSYKNTSEPCDAHFNVCALFDNFWLVEQNTHPWHYKAWKIQDNFSYNSDWIHLKEESHIHLDALRASKTWTHFWCTFLGEVTLKSHVGTRFDTGVVCK